MVYTYISGVTFNGDILRELFVGGGGGCGVMWCEVVLDVGARV